MTKTLAAAAVVSALLHCLPFIFFSDAPRQRIFETSAIVEISLTAKGIKTASAYAAETGNEQAAAKPEPARKPRPAKKNNAATERTAAKEKNNAAEIAAEKAETAQEKDEAEKKTGGAGAAEAETEKQAEFAAPKKGVAAGSEGVSEKAARAHKVPKPKYPRTSRQKGEEGTAIIEVTVTDKGEPALIRLVSSSGYPRLDKEAMAVIPKASFIPAEKNGAAVTSVITVRIRFSLED